MISHDKYEKPILRYAHYGWQSDSDTSTCNVCQITIEPILIIKSNKHHCRFCGKIICGACSQNKSNKHRICDLCFGKKKELENSLIKLSSIPLPRSFVITTPHPIKINNNTFRFISYDDHIYYYNTIKNEWSEEQILINNQYKYSSIPRNSDAFNTKTNEIYTITAQKLRKMNVINKAVKTIHISSVMGNHKLEDAKCIFVNNEYNIIGGKKSNKHYLWDDENHRLRPKWSFTFSNILKDPGLIYLETTQTLYLFGGVTELKDQLYYGFTTEEKSNYIYKCYYPLTGKLNDKCIWKRLDIKLPHKASNFGIVSCKNEKYILLFLPNGKGYRTEIFIFDVEKEIFRKSLIECPIIGEQIKAFVPNDYSYRMHVLLSGYFRKSKSFDYLPQDIINLIVTFNGAGCDYVHVLCSKKHWKINIEYILKNSEEVKVTKSYGRWRHYGCVQYV